MPGALWYGAITFVSVCVLAFSFWKVRDRKLTVLYLMIWGFTFTFEYVVLDLLSGYKYEPGILRNPVLDGIIGAVASNAFVIPAATLPAAAFRLRWPWVIVSAGIVTSIEFGFLHLGIFRNYWWHTPFTTAGIVLWSFAAKYAYWRLRKRLTTGFRFLALFYPGAVVYATSAYVAFGVFAAYRYRIGWFQDPERDALVVSSGSSFLLALVFALLVAFRVNWWWRAAVLLALMGIDWLLLRSGVLIITGSWSLIHFGLHRLLIIGVLEALDSFVLDRPVPPWEPPADF